MAIFSAFFFFGNIGQENVFYDILERETTFLGYKNKKFRNSKNWDFSKGKTHPFGPKMADLPTFFFLGNIAQENVFYNILERRNACLGYENSKLKTSKSWDFSTGVNAWFWSKNGHFFNFFFLLAI